MQIDLQSNDSSFRPQQAVEQIWYDSNKRTVNWNNEKDRKENNQQWSVVKGLACFQSVISKINETISKPILRMLIQ